MRKDEESIEAIRGFISEARASQPITKEAEVGDKAGRKLDHNRAWRAKQQAQTTPHGQYRPRRGVWARTQGHRTWESWEYEVLRREGLSVKEKALILRRSYESTRNKLYRKDRWPEAERP